MVPRCAYNLLILRANNKSIDFLNVVIACFSDNTIPKSLILLGYYLIFSSASNHSLLHSHSATTLSLTVLFLSNEHRYSTNQ